MPYFPAFIDLSGRTCVLVGAGPVGRRKLRRLIHCRAEPLVVIEPYPSQGLLQDQRTTKSFTLHVKLFDPGDIKGAFLVVASTSSPEINATIGRLCKKNNILCNVVDQPELCSLIWPSLVNQGDLALAVSSGGGSPALTRRIRQQLEQDFGPEYAVWISMLKALRPAIIGREMGQKENAAIFRALTDQAFLHAIAHADGKRLWSLLQKYLPQDLHPFAREVLHEHDFFL